MTDTGLAHGDSSRPNEGLLGDSRRKLNEGNRLVELKAEIASALSLADKHSTSPHSPKTSEKDSDLASELSSKCVVSVPIAQHLNSLPSTEQSASTNARSLAPEELTRSESKSSIVSQSDTYPCAASPAPTDTSRASASPLTSNDSASSIAASPVAVPRLSLSKLVTEPTDSYPTKNQSEPVSEAAWNAAVTRLERALSLPEPAMSRACRTLFVQLQREGWTQAEVSHLYWCALCELNPRLASLNS